MIAKHEKISKELKSLYNEYKPGAKVLIEFNNVTSLAFFNEHTLRNAKSKKIKSVERLPIDHIATYYTQFRLSSKRKNQLIHTDATGLYKITFHDDEILLVAKWYVSTGKMRVIEAMFAGSKEAWSTYLKIFNTDKRNQMKPKSGMYRIWINSMGIVEYEKLNKLPCTPIFHEECDKIKESINFYFDDPTKFMRYNQPGRLSMLLYGPQGTGKSSILYGVTNDHHKDKCVVVSIDIAAIVQHVKLCEKYQVPTISIFEDAESVFMYNDSGVKNFLSGIDAKQNKKGTCLIFTTNYPEQIEDTIKNRPDRIDEYYEIGVVDIENQWFNKIVTFYFKDYLTKKELGNIQNAFIELYRDGKLKNRLFTGAQIKLLVSLSLKLAARKNKKINLELIKESIQKQELDIKKLNEYNSLNALKGKPEKKPMGFVTENTKLFPEIKW